MSDQTQARQGIEAAICRLDGVVELELQAGADRCVLAAACIWTGVAETIALTGAECTAATLRSIAQEIHPQIHPQIHPPIETPAIASLPTVAAVRGRNAVNRVGRGGPPPLAPQQPGGFTADIAGDVVDEAIDLIDRGHVAQARALLMALRAQRPKERAGDPVIRREHRRLLRRLDRYGAGSA